MDKKLDELKNNLYHTGKDLEKLKEDLEELDIDLYFLYHNCLAPLQEDIKAAQKKLAKLKKMNKKLYFWRK